MGKINKIINNRNIKGRGVGVGVRTIKCVAQNYSLQLQY